MLSLLARTCFYASRLFFAVLCVWLLASCSGHHLPEARSAFYRGDYTLAKDRIGTEVDDGKDSVLVLMERGTIYQAEGEYKKSSRDFIRANDTLKLLETYSVSEGAGSWVVNDTVYSFEGAPFEQTMLHSMTALNHLALGNWADGGVEARRILFSLRPDERDEDYPDDAFSRYLAAFILEMTGDRENAEAQYSMADELLPDLHIDRQGRVEQETEKIYKKKAGERELVCFFLLGHSPSMREVRREYHNSVYPPNIRIYGNNRHLGDAVILTNVQNLAISTWNIEAPARIAKMAARIAAKEVFAKQLEKNDEALGALARIILIGLLERPDFRRWETLPQWLAVARLPFPDDLSSFEVRLQGSDSVSSTVIHVQQPLVQRGNIVFSFVRDLPNFNGCNVNNVIDKSQ